MKKPTTYEKLQMKVPPQAIDFEEAVLGELMLESEAINRVANKLSPELFYNKINREVYKALEKLHKSSVQIDILSVSEQLKTDNKLESIGGPYYLTTLMSKVVSATNIEFQVQILLQKYLARELINHFGNLSEKAFDGNDVIGLLDEAGMVLDNLNEISISGNNINHISHALEKANMDYINRHNRAAMGKTNGIPSGILTLDKLTNGWQKNNLIVLAARPGMGKSALMLHFAISAAKAGNSVCIYSLEMSDISLANRLILSACQIDVDHFRSGTLTHDEMNKMSVALETLKNLPIYIDDQPNCSMKYIHTNSKLQQRRGKCDIVLIDYLQLADMTSDSKYRNREQEVSETSRAAKNIAKELDIPVILLSQLSRKVEERGDKKPQLSDLRESGAIEQDADLVCLIYRPEYYHYDIDSEGNSVEGVGTLLVEKHRDGATGAIKFSYNKSLTQIGDYDEFATTFNNY